MKVLLVPSWYPSKRDPLNGVFFLEQARALQRGGHQVSVLVAPSLKSLLNLRRVRSLRDVGPVVEIEEYGGLPTYRIAQFRWIPLAFPSLSNRYHTRVGMRLFARLVEQEGLPDVIHAHGALYGGALAVALGRERGIPVVLTEHLSNFVQGTLTRGQREIAGLAIRGADRVFAVGTCLAEKVAEFLPKQPPEVLGNSIDTRFFFIAPKPLPRDPFHFVAVGGMIARKGFDLLINAFAESFRNRPFRLTLVGDGELRDHLLGLARHLEVDGQIEFPGLLDRRRVREVIQRSHVMVSSSYFETFGVSLIEAMACGKPVVATRSGGPESFVAPQNGVLVSRGSVASLRSGLEQVVERYDTFDAEEIRAGCARKFSEEVIVATLTRTYEALVAAR